MAKKCKACKALFTPCRPLQVVCSPKCGIDLAVKKRAIKERKELRDEKTRLKTRSEWLKEVQAVFNKYVRLRDDKLPCVSCGRNHEGQWHAGHYLPTSTRPSLRFHELNVHKQCSACNNHLHGNIVPFRQELIKRVGLEMVEWLEGDHPPKKYTVDDLKQLKEEYQRKIKFH